MGARVADIGIALGPDGATLLSKPHGAMHCKLANARDNGANNVCARCCSKTHVRPAGQAARPRKLWGN
eukprot:1304741-Lingulodinium_polyedra.AAC.1